ncbi:MAG: P-loop NTPase [Candidatus Gracilibacteria bacterium]
MNNQPHAKLRIPGVGKILGVVSGKGGVGKTFVATSIALTLAKLGHPTALLDANISCPNVFKCLGIQNKIMSGSDHKLLPIQKWGLKVISMAGLTASEDDPVMWRGPLVSKIIQQMMMQSIWGEVEFLIIDFPTGTTDSSVTIMQNFEIDGVIAVTTPQGLAIPDTRRIINASYMMNIPVVGVVENMRGEIFGEGGGNKIADMYRLPLLCSIPMRKQIVTLSDAGSPPVFHMEEIEMMFTKMGRNILDKIMVE